MKLDRQTIGDQVLFLSNQLRLLTDTAERDHVRPRLEIATEGVLETTTLNTTREQNRAKNCHGSSNNSKN